MSLKGYALRSLEGMPRLHRAARAAVASVKGSLLRDRNANRVRYQLLLRELSELAIRNRLSPASIDAQGRVFLEMRDGIRLYCNVSDPSKTSGEGQSLDLAEATEPAPFENWLLNWAPKGGVFFDVGANNGYFYAIKLARRLRNDCRIFCFEPDPRILSHLKTNREVNGAGSMEIIEQAVGSEPGELQLTWGMGASNFLVQKGAAHSGPTLQVPVTTMDEFVRSRSLDRIDFVKVDIEGGEAAFVAGAREALRRFEPVLLLECNDRLLARSKSSESELLESLRSLGYVQWRVEGCADLVCFKPSRHPGLAAELKAFARELG